MTRTERKAHHRAVTQCARELGVYTDVIAQWASVRNTYGMPAMCAVEVVLYGVCYEHHRR